MKLRKEAESYLNRLKSARSTSLREALIAMLNSEDRIFDLQEIYMKIEDFYNVTEYQRNLDLKYPSPRIQHEVRSHLANLVGKRIILNPSRAKYCIIKKINRTNKNKA